MMILALKIILTILLAIIGALVTWLIIGEFAEFRNWPRLFVELTAIFMVALDIKILWFM
jgi:hypothetical protein